MTEFEEIWKPVLGYEGYYKVSNKGNVKSSYSGHWKLISPCVNDKGYYATRLYIFKISKSYPIHRIVVESFLGIRPQGMITNHKDGNKLNNYLENLEYITQKANVHHALKLGLLRRGEECDRSILTENDVIEIRKLAPYTYYRILSERFGVDATTICNVVTRKRWKHI